ncbi:MAG: sugar ABC transporter substrate-binding protein [Fastidiosipilaceae bacterium]|jgi:ribose transport system substrate-binding protein
MKLSKRILSGLIAATFLLIGISACGKSADTEKTTAQTEASGETTEAADKTTAAEIPSGNKKISVILMAANSDYWHMVEAGATLAGNEFGYDVTVVGPNSESDSVGQSNMVQDAVNNKVAAIVLAPNEPKVLVKATEYAKDEGVPVVLIDAILDTDDTSLYDSFIGTDNREAGKSAGEYLANQLQPGDKVAIIRGLVGQTSHDLRADGAEEAFNEAGMDVVAVQPADSDRGKAVNVMENILQSHPDVKAVYCTNDEMALGAYQAIKGKQLEDEVMTMGFDGSFGALDSIKAGELTASLAQKPIDEGYLGVKTAIELIEGKTVDKNIANGFIIVDSDNIEEFSADIDTRMAEAGQ